MESLSDDVLRVDGIGRGEVPALSMNGPQFADDGRAPICPFCGVTALPGDLSHVLDTRFVCENPDCEAFGEVVRSES